MVQVILLNWSLAALRVPLAVTWLTVYRQLQMLLPKSNTNAGVIGRRVGRDKCVGNRPLG